MQIGPIFGMLGLAIVVSVSSVSLAYALFFKVKISEFKNWKTSNKYYFAWVLTAIISLGALLACIPFFDKYHFELEIYYVGIFSHSSINLTNT